MNLEHFILTISEPNEIWKDIPEFEDSYMISTHGRVLAKDRINAANRKIPAKLMTIQIGEKNIKTISLTKNKHRVTRGLMSLMAETFIPEYSENQVLHFKDSNPLNCNINNIYWVDKIDPHTKYDPIKPLDDEIWKNVNVSEYENLYAVSNKGRIKALSREIKASNRIIHYQEKLLSPQKDKKGYFYITLKNGGKSKSFAVHILVAITFIPNPNNYPCVDHIDTITSNNYVENLRWVTQQMNMNNKLTKKHASEAILRKQLRNQSWNCAEIVQLKNNELINVYPSVAEAVRSGYSKYSIYACLSKKRETCKGYKWMYLSEYKQL